MKLRAVGTILGRLAARRTMLVERGAVYPAGAAEPAVGPEKPRNDMREKSWFIAAGVVATLGFLALVAWPVVDFGAGASGLVVDENGTPLSGVAVRFTPNRPLYSAISPVRSARAVTDDAGRFALHFIACGRPGGDYRITLDKRGFETGVVLGRGLGNHRIIMKAMKPHAAGAA